MEILKTKKDNSTFSLNSMSSGKKWKSWRCFCHLFFPLNWTPWASEKNLHQMCFPAGDLQNLLKKWSLLATFCFHWTELPAAADHEMKKCYFICIFVTELPPAPSKTKKLGPKPHFFFIELNSRGLRAERKRKVMVSTVQTWERSLSQKPNGHKA